MEMALAPLCGKDDIITPMESNQHTNIPRNFYENTIIGRAYSKSKLFRKCIDRHSSVLGKWYYEHMPALRVKELVGNSVWNSYYKFCFERNPWDKVVSYYNWKKHGQNKSAPQFANYVIHKSHRLPMDARLYFDNNICMMDNVYDYTDFINSFKQICQKLDIPFNGNMPNEKTGINKNKHDYKQFYNEETQGVVEKLFAREIKLMNYQFTPSSS